MDVSVTQCPSVLGKTKCNLIRSKSWAKTSTCFFSFHSFLRFFLYLRCWGRTVCKAHANALHLRTFVMFMRILIREYDQYWLAIYGPMIFMAPYVMILMQADPIRGQVGGGWALKSILFWALWNGIKPLGEVQLVSKKVVLGYYEVNY